VDDAHLLERLDDESLDAEVGEGLGERGLGLVGLLGGGERLVGRRDVGVGLVGVEVGLVERQVLVQVGRVEIALRRGRVCLRVQRIRLSTSAGAARASTTRTDRGAEGRRPGRR
jgi:hypothetical protein